MLVAFAKTGRQSLKSKVVGSKRAPAMNPRPQNPDPFFSSKSQFLDDVDNFFFDECFKHYKAGCWMRDDGGWAELLRSFGTQTSAGIKYGVPGISKSFSRDYLLTLGKEVLY